MTAPLHREPSPLVDTRDDYEGAHKVLAEAGCSAT